MTTAVHIHARMHTNFSPPVLACTYMLREFFFHTGTTFFLVSKKFQFSTG